MEIFKEQIIYLFLFTTKYLNIDIVGLNIDASTSYLHNEIFDK